ncbi:170 kDa surface lectin precursor, putative [Entamoeba invadens IP1]|uniref:170 kDa surface lectin, putative n=1 Tax=Entamoeba invadens IP1 TaxID=370355 RepID=A0A0A1U3V5_ENTIV|nr:170 kDa surface lectin precursor, putative [Entamoeba invadens IP1]ELP88909.1 170 kDa surface lectin precursor, putative [Entamoeba invadens IP1]|eukprot:XP_004255680.1 170 kDa surface lectin precursor, putative [Entamoeba invadens IP1]
MFIIIFLTTLLCFTSADLLNEFSGDVDIYDNGRMGRGKNAGMWQHSYDNGVDIFYYLAMQPWRHFVWTQKEGNDWVTKTMNEDNNVDLSKNPNLDTISTQDFCQKDYGYPIRKFEIDWDRVPTSEDALVPVNVNGQNCYQYPAKSPLVSIILSKKRTSVLNNDFTICRFDFIGGKSITFRSFNGYDDNFMQDYQTNTTSKCKKSFTANNVKSDMVIVWGISDKAVLKSAQDAFTGHIDLPTITNDVTIYYLKGEAYSTVKKPLSQINGNFLSSFEPAKGKVDALITAAKRELAPKVASGATQRGTILVLTDEGTGKSFNANTDFDVNNITVHVVSLNRKGVAMTAELTTLLSLGDHFHETTDPAQVPQMIKDAFVGIRVNLTQRCDRKTCNGFCDAKNRCTCPMCCENTCYYTYCDTKTASCTPWPPAKPKEKVSCPADCVGDRVCKDLEGCVYSRYNSSCEPPVACMVATCPNGGVNTKCALVDNCKTDDQPAPDGYCYTYKCDAKSGYCIKDKKGSAKCPSKTSKCQQYKCSADLTCKVEDKVCVKTIPYVEMDCYVARCNEKTGQCENRLKCDTYSQCGGTVTESKCRCNAETNNVCKCDQNPGGNYCDDKTQICDYTGETPVCKNSNCKEDLINKDCMKAVCNEATGVVEYQSMVCNQTVKIATGSDVCKGMWGYTCKDNACVLTQIKADSELFVDCGYCKLVGDTATYVESCSSSTSSCGGFKGTCKNSKCVYTSTGNAQEFCQKCIPLSCGADSTVYSYTYNEETGKCSYTVNAIPQCSACDNTTNKYTPNCVNKQLDKTWTSGNGVTIDYKIPKDCKNNQCIPRYPLSCTEEDLFGDVFKKFGVCMDQLVVSYHYSSKIDNYNFAFGYPQSDEFMAEADAEAYCEWSFVESNCQKCVITPAGGEVVNEFTVVDQCPKDQNGVQFICLNNECLVDPDFKCQPKDCKVSALVGEQCTEMYNLCDNTTKTLEENRKKIYDKTDKVSRSMRCDSVGCVNGNKCPVFTDDVQCSQKAENEDFGCRRPTYMCDGDNGYYCKFVEFDINDPHEDTAYFLEKSKVKLDNKCFRYQCVETCTGGSDTYEGSAEAGAVKCTHYWNKTYDNSEPSARNLCEDASCDPETGDVVYKDKQCVVSEEFPTLTSNQARCFYCQCSYIDGSASLVMFADTEKEHYQLDACGNCMVMNQSDLSQQLNDKVECILAGEINNSGAIAAATTVAAVVVALVVALIAVSIGLFKTYQLVSSAMKNVVNVANENAQFKAADNEAANTNFNE